MEGIHFNPSEGAGGDNQENAESIAYKERLISAIKERGITIQGKGGDYSDIDGNLALQIILRGLRESGAIEDISEVKLHYVRPQDLSQDEVAQNAAVFIDVGNTNFQSSVLWEVDKEATYDALKANPEADDILKLDRDHIELHVDHHGNQNGMITSASRHALELMKRLDMWPEETRPNVDWEKAVSTVDVIDNKSYLKPGFTIPTKNAIGLQHVKVENTSSDAKREFYPLAGVHPYTKEVMDQWLLMLSMTGAESGREEDVDSSIEIPDNFIKAWRLEPAVQALEKRLAETREDFQKLESEGWVQTTPEGHKVLLDVDNILSKRFRGVDLTDLAYEQGVTTVIKHWTPETNINGPYRGSFISAQEGDVDLSKLGENPKFKDGGEMIRDKMYIYNSPDLHGPKMGELLKEFNISRSHLPEEIETVMREEAKSFEDQITELHLQYRPYVKFTPEGYSPDPKDRTVKYKWRKLWNLGSQEERDARAESTRLKALYDLEQIYNAGLEKALVGRDGELTHLRELHHHVYTLETDPIKADLEYNQRAYEYVQSLKRNYLGQNIREKLYEADSVEIQTVEKEMWEDSYKLHNTNLRQLEQQILPDLGRTYEAVKARPLATSEQKSRQANDQAGLEYEIGYYHQEMGYERTMTERARQEVETLTEDIYDHTRKASDVEISMLKYELLDYELNPDHIKLDILNALDYFDAQSNICAEMTDKWKERIGANPRLATTLEEIQVKLLKNHKTLIDLKPDQDWYTAGKKLLELRSRIQRDFEKYQQAILTERLEKGSKN